MRRTIDCTLRGGTSSIFLAPTYRAAEKSAREKVTSTTELYYRSLTRPSLVSEGVASETTHAR